MRLALAQTHIPGCPTHGRPGKTEELVREKEMNWRQLKKMKRGKEPSPLSLGYREAGEESMQPLADKIEQLWCAAACGT